MLKFLCLASLLLSLSCASGPTNYVITFYLSQGEEALGEIKLILYDSTPIHRENFISLVRAGAYDGTTFHRVIQNFMIQGGDVPKVNTEFNADSTKKYSPDSTLQAEFNPNYFHKRGALAAARLGDGQNPERRSSAYQFYIVQGKVYEDSTELTLNLGLLREGIQRLYQDSTTIAQHLDSLRQIDYDTYIAGIYALIPTIEQAYGLDLSIELPEERLKAYTSIGGTPHLDDQYTVFGEVVEGLALVDSVAATPTDNSDKPIEPVTVTRAVLEEISIAEFQKLYGNN